jgi:hypothetical protein
MKLDSKTISIRALVSFTVLGLAVLLAPLGVFAQTAPVARNDYAVTLKDAPITIDVAHNDYDSDGDLNLTSVAIPTTGPGAPAHGVAVSNPDGTVTYTPTGGFTGKDSFTYTISDNTLQASEPATVTIEVLAEATVVVSFNVIPKKLNMNKKGVVPFVIRDTEEFNVEDIDLESISIMIDPSSTNGINLKKPAKRPGHSNRINLKIGGQDIIQEIVAAYEEVKKGDEITLYLTGNLKTESGGGEIFGQDTVIITGQPKHQD